ncbi:AAA domain-containing protein [Thalassospira lucentensis]|uniref:AAA domain-containing protein n=1 Tax=Thalassospira lucentensis TaxID=168935 RepID=UPI003D2EAEB0
MNKLLIDYWRHSIADTQRMSPSISGETVFELDNAYLSQGHIPSSIAAKLVDEHRKEIRRRDKDADVENVTSAPVAITPFVLLERLEHTQVRKRSSQNEAAAVWIVGKVNEEGHLFSNPECLPWIERASLTPVATRSFVVGTVDDVDRYLETHKPSETASWRDTFEYAADFWKTVTSKDLLQPEFDDHAIAVGRITLFSEQKPAGKSLIELCDKLRDYELESSAEKDTALHRIIDQGDVPCRAAPVFVSAEHAKAHLGHIGEHTLASSQRQALTCVVESNVGDIVAVNGPPGTGKTTLVQSILASGVVKAALAGETPFTMLACSTNNQAVTNLIDSLTKAATPIPDDILSERWIPEASSLGLYFASSDARKRNDNGKYLFAGVPAYSFPDQIENSEFVESAKQVFLEKAKLYFGNDTLDFEQVGQNLHAQLKNLNQSFEAVIDDVFSLADGLNALKSSGQDNFSGWIETRKQQVLSANEQFDSVKKDVAKAQQGIDRSTQQARSLRRRVQSQLNAANLIELLLGFMPDIRRRKINRAIEAIETAGFHKEGNRLHDRSASLEDVDTVCADIVRKASAASIPQEISENLRQAEINQKDAITSFQIAENAAKNWEEKWSLVASSINSFNEMTVTAGLSKLTVDGLKNQYGGDPKTLLDELDTLLRRRLFFLSLRYWENRWLSAAEKLTPEDRKRQGEKHIKERFERYAMLTPCFVATFHKASAVFRHYGKVPSNTNETPQRAERPLRGFFDLLVVDEAGQVSPELGAPCFYLAKRAAVVGDTLQIPPVITLNKHVDHGNLHKAGLDDFSDDLSEKGYVSTTGNIMKMAQSLTSHTLDDVPGLFLSEHRRCYNEVIAYCNKFYQGRLKPMRGPAPTDEGALPPIGYAHIDGEAARISGSWVNSGEARAIADWILRNRQRLEKRYSKPIDEIMAVVTPFRRQANLIITELENVNLNAKPGKKNAITVGTVHSLQGSEREVVLFSSVYDRTNDPKYFFDNEHSMLNVAVSRAKDSFLVFGDMHIFRPGKSHSGQLADLMFSKESNEIGDVLAPQKLLTIAQTEVQHISTLEGHREALVKAFNDATERLLLVSPFLSINAVNKDNIISLVKAAMSRNVDINIVTCAENIVTSGTRARDAVTALEATGATITKKSRIHNKTLAVDSKTLIEGSFNWLSASRDEKFSQQERSFAYHGEKAGHLIQSAWDDAMSKDKGSQNKRT